MADRAIVMPKGMQIVRETQGTVQLRERLLLTLEGMGPLGACVAHYQGLTLHVFGGIPGEEVTVEVVRRRREIVEARVVEVHTPSPHRVQPPCPYFWPCTGCQWQHISYEQQLEIKRELVLRQLLFHNSIRDVPVSPTASSPQAYGYRNHARFTVGPGGTLGFVNRVSREFVPVENCLLMHPWINDAVSNLQRRCAETTQLSIRYGVNTGDSLIQPRLLGNGISLHSGQESYLEKLCDHTFRVASASFFQVNTYQTEFLVKLIRERLSFSGQEVLVDAYAGVGTFAVLLAPFVQQVLAIEESAAAVRDARANASGLSNVEFFRGKTEDVFASFIEKPSVVVLDPPRTGCHPNVLVALARLAPERVVYVSCDPESLARDLDQLAQGPFEVLDVQPIDMFPQTHHVECVAFLSLRESGISRSQIASSEQCKTTDSDLIGCKQLGGAENTGVLTLASTSPRREMLMALMDCRFRIVDPTGCEDDWGDNLSPEALVQDFAMRKAQFGAKRMQAGFSIGADTLVVLEGRSLGKPRTLGEARGMLRELRGREHQVITGVAVVDCAMSRMEVVCCRSSVKMRSYTDDELEAYLSSGEPMDKAGAYAIQDKGFDPVANLEGCYTNVLGLPLCTLTALLARFGERLHLRDDVLLPGECIDCSYLASERGG